MRTRYEEAGTFPEYLESVEKNRDLWHTVYERARVPDDVLEEARRIPGPFHLLALSEDWCGDAVNTLPVVARLAEAAGGELRVLGPRGALPGGAPLVRPGPGPERSAGDPGGRLDPRLRASRRRPPSPRERPFPPPSPAAISLLHGESCPPTPHPALSVQDSKSLSCNDLRCTVISI